jgi:hypothetical protein
MSHWMFHFNLLCPLQGLSSSFDHLLHERLSDWHSQHLPHDYSQGLCLILSGAQIVDKSSLISVSHNEALLLFQPLPTAASAIIAIA